MMNGTSEQGRADLRYDSESVVRTLWKAKRFIAVNFFAVVVIAVIVSLLLPVWYRSSATLLPPTGALGDVGLGGGGVISPVSLFNLGGASDEINKYISILKSRNLRETVIREFDLMTLYSAKTLDDALRRLDNYIEMEISDEGALVFSILDRDSVRAKNLADAFLRELGRITIDLGTKVGQRNRRFISSRISAIEEKMAITERAIQEFTAQYGTFELPTQLAVGIEQLVLMEVLLAQAEIEYNVASSSLNQNHPKLTLLRLERDELDAKVEELITGHGKSGLLPRIKELPDATVKYARLKRDIELQGALMQFLYPQYEQARLQETKDEPALLTLDHPRVPNRKAKPKRSIIVLASGLFSLLLSSAWVVVRPQLRSAAS